MVSQALCLILDHPPLSLYCSEILFPHSILVFAIQCKSSWNQPLLEVELQLIQFLDLPSSWTPFQFRSWYFSQTPAPDHDHITDPVIAALLDEFAPDSPITG